jgi:hypothetical protein
MDFIINDETSLEIIRELDSIEELRIFFKNEKRKTFDFDILPRSLKILNISSVLPMICVFSHPNIEELYVKNLMGFESFFDVDECPKLKKFRTDILHCPVKCFKERFFTEFSVEKSWMHGPAMNFRQQSYSNIKIYSEKQQKWRCAFDLENETKNYYESMHDYFRFNMYRDIYEAELRTTSKIDEEFYKKRPGITSIDFTKCIDEIEIDDNTELHKNITKIICNPQDIGKMIYFESLVKIYIKKHEDSHKDTLGEFLKNYFNKSIGIKIDDFIQIEYNLDIDKYGTDRLEFEGKPMFKCYDIQLLNSCIDFIARQNNYSSAMISTPGIKYSNIKITNSKVNYIIFSRGDIVITRKPRDYIDVRGIPSWLLSFGFSKPVETNCPKVIGSSEGFDYCLFSEGIIIDPSCFNLIKCSPTFTIRTTKKREKMYTLSFPNGFEKFSFISNDLNFSCTTIEFGISIVVKK